MLHVNFLTYCDTVEFNDCDHFDLNEKRNLLSPLVRPL